jgi:DNA-binding response OmpR family regulator
MNVFIVEDNENVREAAAGYLKLEGYQVSEFGKIAPAEAALAKNRPDLIILDVMLPDGDGFLFAKRLKQKNDIPIIFLTARDQESDRITGLELGADDYVVKPFSTRELVLRVKAVLNRRVPATAGNNDQHEYILGEETLSITESQHRTFFNGKEVQLTAAEWNILSFLSSRGSQVFSRLQILEYCLESIAEGSERTVDTHIKNIRHKLSGGWIETVRGFGYRFNGKKA